MPAVQAIQRFDYIIAQAQAQTVSTAALAVASMSWVDRFGNALTFAAPSGCRLWELTNYLSGRLQPMQGWRLSNTGNGSIAYAHGYAPVIASGQYEGILPSGPGAPYETLEGVSAFNSLQIIGSTSSCQFTLEIMG
jgi:hypothetical protein